MTTNTVSKGRKVNGPRTKLAATVRLANLEEAVVSLADSMAIMAKAYLRKEDDMMATPPVEDDENGFDDGADEFGGGEEDELEPPMDLMNMADDFDSDFDPYGGTEDDGGSYREGEDTENELGIHDGDLTKAIRKAAGAVRPLNRARVNKDDAASSFGEKDEDIPGNRPNVPDDKGKPAEQYLIQGGPGDGAGPVSKAFRKAVRAELVGMGLIKKASSPRIGAGGDSQVNKGGEPSYNELVEQGAKLSFAELNRKRVEIGDLPSGIL